MSHNPSAKRNRQFRSGETRGCRQVCGLAAAVTPPPCPPPAAHHRRPPQQGPATAASPVSPVSPGNPADKTG
jgi:hypothetical protein